MNPPTDIPASGIPATGIARKDDANQIIEYNSDFSLKRLFDKSFSLLDVDLLETLGTGNFGRVKLAKALGDGKFYAIKMMKKSRIVRQNQIKQVQNEMKILSRLRCSFVVDMHAVFQDDYSMFFLLEFVPGGEMFSYLRRMGNFDTSLARFYAVEIICALYAMHELKIAYRDIKPENILIDKLGHIRLVDFGFAKIVEDRTYTLCGTPEYLAPEVIKGSGHGLGVDYWSLGVLVYEMSVGYPPFYGDNPFTVYQRILEAQVNYPPTGVADAEGLSKPMQSLVSGLLTPNRTTRLGCGAGGIYKLKKHAYFKGVDWYAASKMLIMPPLVPSVSTDGDTSNFDIYPDEIVEEQANLTSTQREEFMRLDELIDRIPSAM